jgi:hypothetical protein
MMRSQEVSELGSIYCRTYRMALIKLLLTIPADVKETATADFSSAIEFMQPVHVKPKQDGTKYNRASKC